MSINIVELLTHLATCEMEDYFSIDDILASEPRIYATFRVQGHNLAHLDPLGVASYHASHTSSEELAADPSLSSHIPASHRLALPYWLVESLAERSVVSVHLPRCYATPVRNALRADARAVPLFRHCPFYYTLGIRLARLLSDPALPPVLAAGFAARCWHVADVAALGSGGCEKIQKLDWLERDAFFAAVGAAVAIRRWKERRTDRIEGVRGVLGKRSWKEVGSPVTPSLRVS